MPARPPWDGAPGSRCARASTCRQWDHLSYTLLLPACLDHAGDLAVERELAKTQAAKVEFAQISARPAATPATIAVTAPQLGNLGQLGLQHPLILGDLGGCCHSSCFSLLSGRHRPT